MIQSSTIIFLTGAYISHSCWDTWQIYFNEKGYKTIAPPWPGKNATAESLRMRHPDPHLAAITMEEVLNHYASVIHSLPEKPILIGHSFGGLFAQILLNKGLAAAAVSIHAVPPKGIFPYELNFYRSNLPLFGFFSSLQVPYLMPFKQWTFAFTNGMPPDVQKAAYEQYIIPESKVTARGGLTNAAAVDFKKPHAPLLMLAGSDDHCIPEHLCRRVFESYTDQHSSREYIVNKRNHFVLGQPGWQEVASRILTWLKQQ